MKKIYIPLFFILTVQRSASQTWVPLGSNEQTQAPVIQTAASTFFTQVSSTGVPYISYIDDVPGGNNTGDFKVHARRFNSNTGQWEFAGDGISPMFPGSDDFPVALDGTVPYVAYSEASAPVEIQNKISVKRLNNITGLWETVGQQGLSDGAATSTAIAAGNGKIYVAYADGAFDSRLTVKVFDNAHPANGWQTAGTTGFSSGFVLGVNITVDNGIPYVGYLDFTDNALVIKQFINNNWVNVGTNGPSNGQPVVIRSLQFNSNHKPFIAYSNTDGTGLVRSLNTANEWVTISNQPFAASVEAPVALAVIQDIPFVTYAAKHNGIAQLHVKRFDAVANNWPDAGIQPVTASTSDVNNAALVRSASNKLMLVFRNLQGGIYAKSFDASGVLPVNLTAFTVSRQNSRHILRWTTAGEQDNKLFEIEHSTDGTTFKKIGEVTAQAPAGVGHDYSFTHNQPLEGKNYYRLKQVDNNGEHKYSKIISISFSKTIITLSPNPVIDVLQVKNLPAGRSEIVISSIEGKTIKRISSSTGPVDIDVTDLPKGYYLVHFSGELIDETLQFLK